MKKIIVISLTFVLLCAGWHICFPYYLRWLEGFSFFSTLPDYTDLIHDLPKELFNYLGAFLLQFYTIPLVGPALQALYPVIVVLCTYVIVRRLSDDNENLMWIAFLPLPAVVYYLLNDMNLVKSVSVLFYAVLAMLVVCVATIKRKPFRSIPAFMHNKYLALVIIVLSIGISVTVIAKNDKVQWVHDDAAKLEYLGENQKWDEILETVSVKESVKYDFKRRYVLLALSEKGLLAEHAFRYGLSSSADFVFDAPQDPFECKLNTIFYRALGKNDPAAYYVYLYTLHATSGLTFFWIRTLTDMYLEYKDYKLAKKYMDILSFSTCHGKWLRERMPVLESIKDVEPEYPSPEGRFFTEYFMKDIANMVINDQSNHKYADYILCGTLADKDSRNFLQVFSVISPSLYPDGKIPTLYQEALLILMNNNPELAEKFNIDDEVRARFADFMSLVRSGATGQAKRKFAGTYWAYVL